MSTPHPYRKTRSLGRAAKLIDRARELRQTATTSEQLAWNLLRRLRSRGFRFRRQHPVGPYVADFCCLESRLIIELDGGVHGQEKQLKHDAERDAYLKRVGYTVLRLPNGMVLQAPELFLQEVVGAALLLAG